MKRLSLSLFSFLVVLIISGCGQRFGVAAALGSKDCSPTPLRNLDDSHYKGPMTDTHIHIAPIPDGPVRQNEERPVLGSNITISDYICMMNYESTGKIFAFFPVWEPMIREHLEVVKRTLETYPDRFVPFIMPPERDDRPDGFPTVDAQNLSKMLSVDPELFKGYGEIGLYARGDHGGPKGAPALPPDSDRLREIYPVVRKHKLVIYFHLGEGQKEAFEKTLEANPDINFIWHGDQLIRGSGTGQDLSKIDEILSKHSNAYYGIDELYGDTWLIKPEVSKEEFLAHFKNSKELLKQDWETWKWFIEKHPDQVLWGTDRGWSAPWSVDPEIALTLNTYTRAFIGGLAPSVQEKYAYKNAERLLSR